MTESSNSTPTKYQSLSDSLTVLFFTGSILMWIFAPSFALKCIGVVVCIGILLWQVYRSHFVRDWPLLAKNVVAICVFAIMALFAVPNLRDQLRASGGTGGQSNDPSSKGTAKPESTSPRPSSRSVSADSQQTRESSSRAPKQTTEPKLKSVVPADKKQSGPAYADPVQAPPNQQQCAPGSICNQNSPVQAPQTIYNSKELLPKIVGFDLQPLPAIPRFEVFPVDAGREERARKYNDSLGPERGTKDATDAPGFVARFQLSSSFTDPDFNIKCGGECVTTSVSYAEMVGNGILTSNGLPPVLTTKMVVIITVRSKSKKSPITGVEITPVQR